MSFPHFFYQQCFYHPRPVQDISLAGKTAIVTGANTGLGFETCRKLIEMGVRRLVLGVRNMTKGEEAAARLRGLGPFARAGATGDSDNTATIVEVWSLDQSAYASVVAFAERARKELDRLDFVNLNAATAPGTRIFNESTGHDEVVQVNYLSTALLAILLVGVIHAKQQEQHQQPSSSKAPTAGEELSTPAVAKITLTSSDLPAFTTQFREKDASGPLLAELDKAGPLDMAERMVASKLLCQFFIMELARRVPPSVAVINAATPSGLSDSVMMADQRGVSGAMNRFMMRCIGRPSSAGAHMMVDALVQRGAETHGKLLSFQQVTR